MIFNNREVVVADNVTFKVEHKGKLSVRCQHLPRRLCLRISNLQDLIVFLKSTSSPD